MESNTGHRMCPSREFEETSCQTARKWFFTHKLHSSIRANVGILYRYRSRYRSRKFYRTRCWTLPSEQTQCGCIDTPNSMVSKIIFDPKFIDVDFKRALFRKNEITRRWRPLLKFMSQRKFEFFVVANSMYYE